MLDWLNAEVLEGTELKEVGGGGGGNYTNATQSPPEWFCTNSGVSHLPLIVRGKVNILLTEHRQTHHFPFHLAFITYTVYLNVNSSIQCCFTATETTGLNRIGELRTATSTFTQLLSFEEVLQVNMVLNVHKNYKAY